MTPATYGGLFDDALACTHRGLLQVSRQRFDDKQGAEVAVSAYYALIDAARQHVWALITPARMAGVTASDHAHPVESTAVLMARYLVTGPDDVPPHPSILRPPRHSWDEAARRLRAGADLLSSHTTVSGGARTPDALMVWDDVARHAALGRLGSLVAELSSGQDALALRVGQTGMTWSHVGRWLPPANRLRDAALEVVAAADTVGASMSDLEGLAPATGRVRVARPVDELGDRVARIRRAAWNLRAEPDYSMRTLLDVAQAGFMVTAQTATFHGIDLHDRAQAIVDPNARRAGAWLALMHGLRGYYGAGPGDGRIHGDVTAVHDLLETLIPRGRPRGDRAASANPDERHLAGVLHGGCAGLGQVAEWNAATFARLARSGQVFVRVGTLSRDFLSDHPEHATAKLGGHDARLTVAPTSDTEATLDRYRDVITTMSQRPDPGPVTPTRSASRTAEPALALSREMPSPR